MKIPSFLLQGLRCLQITAGITARNHIRHTVLSLVCMDHNKWAINFTLLSQIRLPLLHGRHDHVTGASSRETIQTPLDTTNGHDKQILRSSVVSAIHDDANSESQ